mmetsp:Transcript_7077/g.23455  ORF Transcript_7077/g.23455 Transcript_7077/m.23455 type:complete len:216 (-) Transcript_7077:2198-2845(-)
MICAFAAVCHCATKSPWMLWTSTKTRQRCSLATPPRACTSLPPMCASPTAAATAKLKLRSSRWGMKGPPASSRQRGRCCSAPRMATSSSVPRSTFKIFRLVCAQDTLSRWETSSTSKCWSLAGRRSFFYTTAFLHSAFASRMRTKMLCSSPPRTCHHSSLNANSTLQAQPPSPSLASGETMVSGSTSLLRHLIVSRCAATTSSRLLTGLFAQKLR